MRQTHFSIIFFIGLCFTLQAQQDAQYTQYMYNMSVINPAYVTANPEVVTIGGIYRTQWVGAEGAPQTGSLFIKVPLKENIEVALNFVNDQIGDGAISENTISGDFAYILKLNENENPLRLSLGLKAGANLLSTDFSDVTLQDAIESGTVSVDPAFNNLSKVFLNVGVGAYLYTDKYYIGVSTPNLLNNTYLQEIEGVSSVGEDKLHIFTTAGYVFRVSEDIRLKPSFMLKIVTGAPLSTDLTLNALIYEKLTLGLAYRYEDSFSGLIAFRVRPNLNIGYAYDHTVSDLGDHNSGSHEIMAIFNLGLKPSIYKSPRFF